MKKTILVTLVVIIVTSYSAIYYIDHPPDFMHGGGHGVPEENANASLVASESGNISLGEGAGAGGAGAMAVRLATRAGRVLGQFTQILRSSTIGLIIMERLTFFGVTDFMMLIMDRLAEIGMIIMIRLRLFMGFFTLAISKAFRAISKGLLRRPSMMGQRLFGNILGMLAIITRNMIPIFKVFLAKIGHFIIHRPWHSLLDSISRMFRRLTERLEVLLPRSISRAISRVSGRFIELARRFVHTPVGELTVRFGNRFLGMAGLGLAEKNIERKGIALKNKIFHVSSNIRSWFSGFIISVVLLGVIFGIWLRPEGIGFLTSILLASVGALIALFIHKVAHILMARHYGTDVKFEVWKSGIGLIIAVAILLGDLFAAPGGIKTRKRLSKDKEAKIAIYAGFANLLVFSVACFFIYTGGIIGVFFFFLAILNIAYAVDNMFPIKPMDGAYVWAWGKGIWALSTIPFWIIAFGFIMAH